MPHARDSRGCIRGKLTITGCVWSDHGGVHCACKCQGLSTLSSSSTADDDEGAVRPQADEDGARMATAGSFTPAKMREGVGFLAWGDSSVLLGCFEPCF